jgi:hypothetical protein
MKHFLTTGHLLNKFDAKSIDANRFDNYGHAISRENFKEAVNRPDPFVTVSQFVGFTTTARHMQWIVIFV